jgi:molybdopterin-guanine dinucleotide biosynthesis protein A
MNDFLSVIILAGGQSSRMGRDKALIEVDGIPLLRRVYDAALHCSHSIYVITSWVDRYRELLPSTVNFIAELSPRSAIVALQEALEQISSEWVLLLACDLPKLDGSVLQQWVSQLDHVSEEAISVLPKHPKGWEPTCGFYRSSCLPALSAYIEQGGRSFQNWLETQIVEVLEVSDRQMLMNCNTPEDLSKILNS